MNFDKRQKIRDKCDHKANKYDLMMNLAYIRNHDDNGSFAYHMQSIVRDICLEAESTRDYDDIFSDLARDVSSLLKMYAKED